MAIMTRGRMAAALLSIGLISAACGTSTEKPSATGGALPAAPTTTDPRTAAPTGADFYKTPPMVAGSKHGDLVYLQKIDGFAFADKTVGVNAWRILYRSSAAADDAPIVVSGMVLEPTAKATGPRPIVAWAHGTVGSADDCAPSKNPSGTPKTTAPEEKALLDQLAFFLRQGWVVVASDYEGLGTPGAHPYLVGKSEGRSVLDSITAVRQIASLGTGDSAVIYGASQGGHAALFAGELASTWAPDTKIAGVVAAAPFSEVDQLLPLASVSTDYSGYYLMGIYGTAAGTKGLNPSQVVDPVGTANAGLLETQCLGALSTTLKTALSAAGKTSLVSTNPLSIPEWKAALTATVAGQQLIGAPILVVQGKNDTTVPAVTTQALVRRMCGKNKVQYVEYDNTGHGDALVSGDRDIRAFIANRLSGAAFTPAC